ncbi:MAG: hypothetical protein C5B51_25925 [Terriglobia bacterium]|nr:MAG: hypothetical protein C5B51_25925 [Terriglobia bacterium]
MLLTKKSLSRRSILRGTGAAVALPLLDAMFPALTPYARAAARPRDRFGVVYIPNGAIMQEFTPATVGEGFAFTPILKPLEPFQDSVVVVTNLTRSHPGSQVGDHAVSCAGFLTGVWPKRTEAEDVLANTTIDQIVAQQIGQETPLPSLEVATEDFTGYVGGCSPGIQLRIHEYDFLEHSQYTLAHGDEPARGIRAVIWRTGNGGRATGAIAQAAQYSGFDCAGRPRFGAGPGTARPDAARRLPR